MKLWTEFFAWVGVTVFVGFFAWLFFSIINEATQPDTTSDSRYYELSFPNGEVYDCVVWERTVTCDYAGGEW